MCPSSLSAKTFTDPHIFYVPVFWKEDEAVGEKLENPDKSDDTPETEMEEPPGALVNTALPEPLQLGESCNWWHCPHSYRRGVLLMCLHPLFQRTCLQVAVLSLLYPLRSPKLDAM